jgi:MurNAc alpha-1-phosphate uridylyltransferase
MGTLTHDLPKPLLPVQGLPLIDHILGALGRYGVQQVIINTHYLAHKMEAHLAAWKGRFPFFRIFPEPTLLGAGGTIVQVQDYLDNEPFFVINADIFWLSSRPCIFTQLSNAWRGDPLLTLVPLKDAYGYKGEGDFFLEEDVPIRCSRSTSSSPQERFVFGGLQALPPIPQEEFPALSSCLPLWEYFREAGRLKGFVWTDPWFHLGTREAYEASEAFLKKRDSHGSPG